MPVRLFTFLTMDTCSISCFLTLDNNAMDILCSSVNHPRIKIAESQGRCIFYFIKNCWIFFKVILPFCIPSNNIWYFQLFYILTNFSYYPSFKILAVPVSVFVSTFKNNLLFKLLCLNFQIYGKIKTCVYSLPRLTSC